MGDTAGQDGASAVSLERAQSEKTETRRFLKAKSSSRIRVVAPFVEHYSVIPTQQVADRVANTGSTYDRDSNPTTTSSMAKIEELAIQQMRLITELEQKLDHERARREREVSNKEKELQQYKAQLEASKREKERLDITTQSLQYLNDELREDKKKLEDRLTEVESGFSRIHLSQTMRESCDQEIRDQLGDIQQQLKSEIKVEQRLDGQDTATHHSSVPLAVSAEVSDVRLEREILMVCGGREVLVRYAYEIAC